MIRSVTQGVVPEDNRMTLEVIRRGGNKTIEIDKSEQLARLRLHYAGHDFKVQGDSIVADPTYIDTPSATLESVYMANTRGKGLARTHIVAPIDELVPDMADRRQERAGQGEMLDEHSEAIDALGKRWMRTIDDVPAITLARQAGIGQLNSAEPAIMRHQVQRNVELRGLSRAA